MKKIIIAIISIILILFLSVLFIVKNNDKYKDNVLKEVNKNYAKDVVIANKYGDKYVVKTKDNIVVLDDKYQEVESISLEEVADFDDDKYELVYRKNQIMYQKKEVKGSKVIYTYYDVKTKEEIDKIEIEG